MKLVSAGLINPNDVGVLKCIPYHHIREYRYAYGAVEPLTGESFFLALPYSNTECMQIFLDELSKLYPNDMILLAADNASWHHSKTLIISLTLHSRNECYRTDMERNT